MLKYLGLSLILLAALIASREYSRRQARRLTEFSELLRLVRTLRNDVSCFLAPRSAVAARFRSSALEALGFCEALRRGLGFAEAFAQIASASALSPAEKQAFAELFSELGRGYRGEELATLDGHLQRLEALRSNLRDEAPKSTRAVAILITSSAVGLILLLI